MAAFGYGSNYMTCIQQQEGKSTNTVNNQGYTGLYQFSAYDAAANGLCSNYKSISTAMPAGQATQTWAAFNSTCDFKGSVAKQYGITSYASWTTGPNATAAQNAVMTNYTASNQAYLNTFNQKYPGLLNNIMINGSPLTLDTELAMLHLGGPSSLRKLVQTGQNNADSNGSTLTGYASCLANCMANGGSGGNCSTQTGAAAALNINKLTDSLCGWNSSGSPTTP